MKLDISLVGHPNAPIGMGEHIRSSFRAFKSIGLNPKLVDIYNQFSDDKLLIDEFSKHLSSGPSLINIFHINADEVDQTLGHLSNKKLWPGYNIIYPAWELEKYPDEYARKLDIFDEIWAPSNFIYKSIKKACKKPVFHMPLSCQLAFDSFLPRQYFNIPDVDYIFLFFFDTRSYSQRKNPKSVIEVFRKALSLRPNARVKLVLKINSVADHKCKVDELINDIQDIQKNVILIDKKLTDSEIKNLVRCSDCFISLHRSEGFGRGISEAMYLGKPVIATAYSGNMDFMNKLNAFNVRYRLVKVEEGEYPFYQKQRWADPDLNEAVSFMLKLIDYPEIGYKIGKKAYSHIRKNFSYQAIGINYKNRLESIN
jgi:glycosyltransferase involved in cell wall biosynthesis